MKWRRPAQRSDDIIDRRGRPGIRTAGAVGLPVILIALLVAFLSGGLGGGGGSIEIPPGLDQLAPAPSPGTESESPLDPATDPNAELVDFMSVVLDDAQNMWANLFGQSGQSYQRAELVLFTGDTDSGCGGASSQVGPHYCPLDQRVYLDLGFFEQLAAQFEAPGDFAQAYVLTHEIGHHVQTLLGISDQVRQAQQADPEQANELSILMELQADCFAGVWAHTVLEQGDLERGDIEEALGAAAAVGDDRIQAGATGMVNPETWTHGSSEQRVQWFETGFRSGDPNSCDTFAA